MCNLRVTSSQLSTIQNLTYPLIDWFHPPPETKTGGLSGLLRQPGRNVLSEGKGEETDHTHQGSTPNKAPVNTDWRTIFEGNKWEKSWMFERSL